MTHRTNIVHDIDVDVVQNDTILVGTRRGATGNVIDEITKYDASFSR